MRPHLLRFAALGSFPGEVEVDFDSLSPYGLFHIHGPTGAGKSSLLDALCFALYGTIPGPRLSDGMRSHHAEPSVETHASLDLSVEETTWRIIRTPTQRRSKRRGNGTTEQRATATLLRRVGDNWVPVASGVKEVDTIIHRLIGLDADQFMQVVVLPQGSFQRALRAGSAERERLLSTLFHTERFGVYADHLKQRATELALARDLRVVKMSAIVAQLRDRVSSLGMTIDEVSVLDPATTEAFEAVSERATSIVRDRKADRDTAEKVHRELTVRMRDLSVRSEVERKRRSAIESLQHLESMSGRIAEQRQLVDRVRELAPMRDQLVRIDRHHRQLKPLEMQREQVLASLAGECQTLPPLASELATAIETVRQGHHSGIETARALCGDLAVTLGGLVDRHDEARRLRDEWQQHERAIADTEARRVGVTRSLEAARQKTDIVVVELQDASSAVETLDELERETERLRSQVTAGRELAKLRDAEEQHEQSWRSAEQQSITAQQEHLTLLRRRLDGMAAELASRLTPGTPCVVCGSLEHPEPASIDDPLTEENVINEAEARAEQARRTARLEHDRLLELRTRKEAAVAVAGPAVDDLAGVTERLDDRNGNLTRARAASEAVARHEKTLTALHSRVAGLDREREQCELDLATLRSIASTTLERLQGLEVSIADAVGPDCAPDREVRRINSISASLHQLSRVVEAHERLEEERRHEQAALDEMLLCSSVADIHELRALTLPDIEIRRIQNELDAHDQALTGARAAVAQFDDVAEVDIEHLTRTEALLSAATERLQRATEEHARVNADSVAIRDLTEVFATQLQEAAPLAHEAERVGQLAALCSGDRSNELRMSLERYVLAAYLEEVAAAASHRLRLMTSGRYTLHHSDARARGNAASGLSLIVDDAYTGGEREVNTLSGGETFLASLALALGVADVVQQYTGGVHVEALFIDEGFGSLDPDSLDLALAELDRLREGGRLVGVISHVATLQQRIPVGIEVIPGHQGSRIQMKGVKSFSAPLGHSA